MGFVVLLRGKGGAGCSLPRKISAGTYLTLYEGIAQHKLCKRSPPFCSSCTPCFFVLIIPMCPRSLVCIPQISAYSWSSNFQHIPGALLTSTTAHCVCRESTCKIWQEERTRGLCGRRPFQFAGGGGPSTPLSHAVQPRTTNYTCHSGRVKVGGTNSHMFGMCVCVACVQMFSAYVHACMCVSVPVCVYASLHACMCLRDVCACLCMQLCVCVCVCVCAIICVKVCAYAICNFVFSRMLICVSVCAVLCPDACSTVT
jgi:hypothetical protein